MISSLDTQLSGNCEQIANAPVARIIAHCIDQFRAPVHPAIVLAAILPHQVIKMEVRDQDRSVRTLHPYS